MDKLRGSVKVAKVSNFPPSGSASAHLSGRLLRNEVREHGLATDHGLAGCDQGISAWRQVDVDPAAEPDQSNPLAGGQRVTLRDKAHDPAGEQAGDLDHGDVDAGRGSDHGRPSLVDLAGVRVGSVDEDAGHVACLRNGARYWCAV